MSDKCSKVLYKLVQERKTHVDDGKGSYNFVHQTDVWDIMEQAFAEGQASGLEVAKKSPIDNSESFSFPEWEEIKGKVAEWWLHYETDTKCSVYTIAHKVYDFIVRNQ